MYGGGAPEISCSLAVAEAAKKVGQLDYPSHSPFQRLSLFSLLPAKIA